MQHQINKSGVIKPAIGNARNVVSFFTQSDVSDQQALLQLAAYEPIFVFEEYLHQIERESDDKLFVLCPVATWPLKSEHRPQLLYYFKSAASFFLARNVCFAPMTEYCNARFILSPEGTLVLVSHQKIPTGHAILISPDVYSSDGVTKVGSVLQTTMSQQSHDLLDVQFPEIKAAQPSIGFLDRVASIHSCQLDATILAAINLQDFLAAWDEAVVRARDQLSTAETHGSQKLLHQVIESTTTIHAGLTQYRVSAAIKQFFLEEDSSWGPVWNAIEQEVQKKHAMQLADKSPAPFNGQPIQYSSFVILVAANTSPLSVRFVSPKQVFFLSTNSLAFFYNSGQTFVFACYE